MKTPEQRKTQSLFLGFIGAVLMMTGGLIMKNLDAIGVLLVIIALVIHFRARSEEKQSAIDSQSIKSKRDDVIKSKNEPIDSSIEEERAELQRQWELDEMEKKGLLDD
jgi:hypothetical protein